MKPTTDSATSRPFFKWLVLIDELYRAASRVTTMTIQNPRLPSALLKLRLALNKVNKARRPK